MNQPEESIHSNKQFILERFNENVRGKEIFLEGQHKHHCGKEGHWLETQMGLKHNAKNEPDILGYEMKTGDKATTFIDKTPDYIYLNGEILPKRNKSAKKEFYDKYASPKNTDKPTPGGWSINKYNNTGQKAFVDISNNIYIEYNYEHDTRENKDTLNLNKSPHVIMQWNRDSLKTTIENKFNQKGFFKCKKEGNCFVKICFGSRITFERWLEEFKKGTIYHEGYSHVSGRGRHQFRAKNSFWDSLITEEY